MRLMTNVFSFDFVFFSLTWLCVCGKMCKMLISTVGGCTGWRGGGEGGEGGIWRGEGGGGGEGEIGRGEGGGVQGGGEREGQKEATTCLSQVTRAVCGVELQYNNDYFKLEIACCNVYKKWKFKILENSLHQVDFPPHRINPLQVKCDFIPSFIFFIVLLNTQLKHCSIKYDALHTNDNLFRSFLPTYLISKILFIMENYQNGPDTSWLSQKIRELLLYAYWYRKVLKKFEKIVKK